MYGFRIVLTSERLHLILQQWMTRRMNRILDDETSREDGYSIFRDNLLGDQSDGKHSNNNSSSIYSEPTWAGSGTNKIYNLQTL